MIVQCDDWHARCFVSRALVVGNYGIQGFMTISNGVNTVPEQFILQALYSLGHLLFEDEDEGTQNN